MSNGEITKSTTMMSLAKPPEEILAEGQKAAKELMRLVSLNKWATKIGTKDHLSFEAWQMVGKFYGCNVRTKSTNLIEIGNVRGYEAVVEVLDREGKVVGGADSMCMSDEQKWKGKPLYSIRSMAQTRAGARALRQMFAWVVVLAGFSPAPTEDMEDGVENKDGNPTPTMRRWISALMKQNKIVLPEGKFCNEEETNLTWEEAKKILKDYKENALNKQRS